MLAHLPGRMSQPSRKGVTSNIFILRCSFHKTAKRLSITGLTHLLRLRSKIQSSIVKALIIKIPNNKKRQFGPVFVPLLPALTSLCCWLALVIRHVILLQTKRKKNTKYHKHCIVSELTIFVFKIGENKEKSRIGLLHRNQFPEGIQLTWTIISQIYRKKKICLKSANDTNIYRLSLWYTQQWKVEVAYSTNATPFCTRCT
jgi:hypothetical protein